MQWAAPHRLRALFLSLDLKPLVFTLFLGLVSFLILTPLFFLFVSSFQLGRPGEPIVYSIEGWRQAFTSPGILSAIYNSFSLALARQLISTAIGIFIAWLLARTDVPMRGWLEFLFWVSFFIPSLPVALGWILLLESQYGLINQWLMRLPFVNKPLFDIYSFWGIVWVHLTSTIAIKVMLLTPAFRNLDAALEESSRVAGAGPFQTLRRVIVPIMMPPILVAFILGLVRSLEAFEIELILGVPVGLHVFSTMIYRFVTYEPPDFPAATALGSFFLVVLLSLVALQRLLIGKRAFTTVTGRGFSTRPISLGRWKTPAFVCVLVVALCTTVVPVVVLFVGTFMKIFGFFNIENAWTLDNWKQVVSDPIFSRSLRNTMILGLVAAGVGMCLSSMIAYAIVKTRFVGRMILDFVSWLPWAIPGILLGLALMWTLLLVHRVIPIYGTMYALVVVMAIGSFPMSVQVTKSFLMQIGDELEEASLVAGASWFCTFRRILLPILLPCLIVVGLLEFIAAARNISSVVLLATGRTRTLAVLMLDFTAGAELEKATVVAAVIVLVVVAAALTVRYLGGQLGIRG